MNHEDFLKPEPMRTKGPTEFLCLIIDGCTAFWTTACVAMNELGDDPGNLVFGNFYPQNTWANSFRRNFTTFDATAIMHAALEATEEVGEVESWE